MTDLDKAQAAARMLGKLMQDLLDKRGYGDLGFALVLFEPGVETCDVFTSNTPPTQVVKVLDSAKEMLLEKIGS